MKYRHRWPQSVKDAEATDFGEFWRLRKVCYGERPNPRFYGFTGPGWMFGLLRYDSGDFWFNARLTTIGAVLLAAALICWRLMR